MIVSHSRKFIFVHNPKCAGTSFRTAIEGYHDHGVRFWDIFPNDFFMKHLDYAHLRLWEVAAIFPDVMAKFNEYQSVIFVKNPYARFVSSVREHFIRFRPTRLSELSADEQRFLVEKFVASEINLHKVLGDVKYVHFSPQNWFISFGDQKIVRHIIPMRPKSNFIDVATTILQLPPLPVERLNSSNISSEAILQSPKVISFIENFYRQDFKLFEKYDHLYDLANPPTSEIRAAAE